MRRCPRRDVGDVTEIGVAQRGTPVHHDRRTRGHVDDEGNPVRGQVVDARGGGHAQILRL